MRFKHRVIWDRYGCNSISVEFETRSEPPVSPFLGRPPTHDSRVSRRPSSPRWIFLIRFPSPAFAWRPSVVFHPRLPRGTVSTTVTIGRSFKMQTRGPWGFKTPAIPGFRSAANLARASYGFTPPLTRFYSRAGRQTFSAPILPFPRNFLTVIRVQRWSSIARSRLRWNPRYDGLIGIWSRSMRDTKIDYFRSFRCDLDLWWSHIAYFFKFLFLNVVVIVVRVIAVRCLIKFLLSRNSLSLW